MKKHNGARLYNILFPIWMLILIPTFWLIIIPSNFIFDSAVFIISMRIMKIAEKKVWYKKHILKIFTFGMIADIIGASYILLLIWGFDIGITGDELYLTIPAVLLSAVMIFLFNFFITFRKIERKQRIQLSLIFALITAPYTFLIPTSWIY